MEKLKKIMAIIVAVATLSTFVSVQSIAWFDKWYKSLPEVESVKFVDDYAVSLKDVKAYFDEAESWHEDGTVEDECYYLDGNIQYEIEVALSNGEKHTMSVQDWYFATFADYEIYVAARISYKNYIEASKNKADKIKVEVAAEVYENATEMYEDSDVEEFSLEKDLVSSYIKSITPSSSLPLTVYEWADYYELDGAKFVVTFADLSKKTMTLTQKTDKNGYVEYYFGDEEVFVYEYGKQLFVAYLDGIYKTDVKYKKEKFADIEITDCDFDSKAGKLASIKGEVTFTDGSTKTFERTFENPIGADDFENVVVGLADGFYIYLNIVDYEVTEEGSNADYQIRVSIMSENMVEDTQRFENPYSFWVVLKVWIQMSIDVIRGVLYSILNWWKL